MSVARLMPSRIGTMIFWSMTATDSSSANTSVPSGAAAGRTPATAAAEHENQRRDDGFHCSPPAFRSPFMYSYSP